MNSFDQDYAAGLFDNCDPPCVSLDVPTHRQHPDNQQDPIRFKNLIKTLEASLLQQSSNDEIQPLLQPFLVLAHECDFWSCTCDDLATLAGRIGGQVVVVPAPNECRR